jgi:outer membrane protein assembly factor BamB
MRLSPRLIILLVLIIFLFSIFSPIICSNNLSLNKNSDLLKQKMESFPKNINYYINSNNNDYSRIFNSTLHYTQSEYTSFKFINIINKQDMWPMKCHDTNHTGRSPYNTSQNTGLEKWRVQSGSWAKAGMAIDANGIVYYGDFQADLTAVFPNGDIKWQYHTGERIRSTPAIGDDGVIYCSSYDAKLYALNYDGSLKWKTGLGGSSTTSPIIDHNGIIYVGTMPSGNSVVAVNPNGTIRWKYTVSDAVMGDIAIGPDGTIYASSFNSNIYALYANGTLKWKFKTGDAVKGPASIASDGTVYIGSWDGYLYALYPENGSMKWQCNIGGTETNPTIGIDGTIYVGNKGLYAIYPNNGTIKWIYSEQGRDIFQSSPAISSDGVIYVGVNVGESSGGEIWAVNSNGSLRWKKPIANENVESSPAIGADGTVYISSASRKRNSIQGVKSIGYLHAFGPVQSNTLPNKPTITGEKWGEVGETYLYEITTTDSENNPLSFFIEWGDGTISDWSEEAASGEIVKFIHTYYTGGRYTIRAKARDTLGEESDWGTLTVRMPLAIPSVQNSPLVQQSPRLMAFPFFFHFRSLILNFLHH